MKHLPRKQRKPRKQTDWPLSNEKQTREDASSSCLFTQEHKESNMTQTNAPQPPEKEFRAGKTSIAIWARQEQLPDGHTVTRYSLRLQKSWRDKDGNWQDSSINVYPDELAGLRLIVDASHAYVALTESEPSGAAA